MANLNDLRTAIDRLLGISAAGQLLKLNSNTDERAYEAYVFSLCCEAVRKAGGTATLVGALSGPNPPRLIFRGGPGSMASTNQDFCHARCQIRNGECEIHVDIEYTGNSGASHEIDVSLYDGERADDVRASNGSPRTNNNLIGAIECKFYKSRPGVVPARTFVGLLSDCSTNRIRAFVSNKSTNGIDLFMATNRRPAPFNDLTPLNADAEDRFVRVIEHKLRQWSISP